jgi:hypothetical protein
MCILGDFLDVRITFICNKNHVFFRNIFRQILIILMLELAQNIILNEDALNNLPEKKRPVFIYEWLCFLNKVLIVAQKVTKILIFTSKKNFFLRMIFEIINHILSNNYYNKFKINLVHQFEY